MNKPIIYDFLKDGEEGLAMDLVLSVFETFVAPEFSDEGVLEFCKYAHKKALTERLEKQGSFMLTAKNNETLIGVIEIRDNHHVAFLFVNQLYQRKGIGKNLLKRAVEICMNKDKRLKKITVNAAVNSVGAYEKMGFHATDHEQLMNGIRFTPMEMNL